MENKLIENVKRTSDLYQHEMEINEEESTQIIITQQKRILALEKELKKYQNLTDDIHKTCVCCRFKTKGFDYHETHPRLGKQTSSRLFTPRDLIENRIGFEWKYEKPSGCGKSWKVVTHKKV